MKKLITILLILIYFSANAATYQITQANIKTIRIASNNVYQVAEQVTGSIALANVHNVTIKSVGEQSFIIGSIGLTGACSDILIQNLDISGGNICIQVRSYGSNIIFDGLTLHGATYGIWLRSNNAENPFNTNVIVDRCRIYDQLNDGFYAYNVHYPKLINSVIYRCNMLWKAPETDQKIASGDGVQWIRVDNPTIEYCTIDRSATGNKFCLIISGTNDVQPNVWKIGNNKFVMPKRTAQGGACIYIFDLPHSIVIDFYQNVVIGNMAGIKYNSFGTFKSSNNKYIGNSTNMPIAIELQRREAKAISISDIFANCTRKGTYNVKFY